MNFLFYKKKQKTKNYNTLGHGAAERSDFARVGVEGTKIDEQLLGRLKHHRFYFFYKQPNETDRRPQTSKASASGGVGNGKLTTTSISMAFICSTNPSTGNFKMSGGLPQK
jgi:hypothetical protein